MAKPRICVCCWGDLQRSEVAFQPSTPGSIPKNYFTNIAMICQCHCQHFDQMLVKPIQAQNCKDLIVMLASLVIISLLQINFLIDLMA